VAAEHLRALMDRYAPGVSARALCRRAGVSESRLNWWTGGRATRPPTLEQRAELARVIGCTAHEVHVAIQLDQDPHAELADGLDADERELVSTYRRLTEPERVQLRRIAAVLHSP
jgi:transcriptional regulator with XRE-family HTH domain